jgi:16S rRNA processing protein RimM
MGPRSTSRSISGDDTLVVGEIRGPHGLRGEVRIDPRTDVADRFAVGAVLDCDGVGALTVEVRRGPPEQPIVKFAGYDRREDAEKLNGKLLRVSRAEARKAVGPGAILWADLVGLAVEDPEGHALGTVRDLIRAGGADVLVVTDDAGRELLLPMLDTVVRSVDTAAGRIVARPLEGLE